MHMITVKVICVLYAEQAVPGPHSSEAGKLCWRMWCLVHCAEEHEANVVHLLIVFFLCSFVYC